MLGGHPAISRTAAPGAAVPRTPRGAFRPRERRLNGGPTAHKRSEQEGAAMSPLNNLTWGSRFGDVTSSRIVRGGLARIECGWISSRWARTARGGVDCVALGSHYASRSRPRRSSRSSRSSLLARCSFGQVMMVTGRTARGRRSVRRRGGPGRWPRDPQEAASDRLLRLFPSATPSHPPLRSFFSYSEGSRGVADAVGTESGGIRLRPIPAPDPTRTEAGPVRAELGFDVQEDGSMDGPTPGRSGPARTEPGRAGSDLRNASPARRNPPHLAPCEPSATKSTRTRSAPAHLAQCEMR